MKIGWLEDPAELIGYKGGAELDGEIVRAVSPHDIVACPPRRVVDGLDAYVIANCVHYSTSDVANISAPIVKIVHDEWRFGDPELRKTLLERAALVVLRSPLHRQRFAYPIAGDVHLLPSQVGVWKYERAAQRVEKRERAVWLANLGSPERDDGLKAAQRWAKQRGVPLDVYGRLTKNGMVPPDDVPELLASYRYFCHAMGRGRYEPFGRAVVEAWAAGCILVTDENVGARWWIENDPVALEEPARDFWAVVDRTVERCHVSAL